jgi:AraC-like DNA-binding protein
MTAHQARFNLGHSCYVLYFDLAFLRPDLADHPPEINAELLARVPVLAPFAYQQDIEFHLSDDGIHIVESLCRRMIAERRSPRLCSYDVTRSYLNLLLAEVARRYEPQIRELMHRYQPNGGVERHVKGIMKFITDNLTEKLTLVEAADVVAVSPNYLAKLLKRETGKTFVELMTEKRMDRARELLAFTDMRIGEVGYAVGFADHNYFCKRFKHTIGCTPLEFRNGHLLAAARHGIAVKQPLVA